MLCDVYHLNNSYGFLSESEHIKTYRELKSTTNISYDRCSFTQHTNDKYKDIYNDSQLMATEAMLPLLSKPVVFFGLSATSKSLLFLV